MVSRAFRSEIIVISSKGRIAFYLCPFESKTFTVSVEKSVTTYPAT
jgi:hypothetical protein